MGCGTHWQFGPDGPLSSSVDEGYWSGRVLVVARWRQCFPPPAPAESCVAIAGHHLPVVRQTVSDYDHVRLSRPLVPVPVSTKPQLRVAGASRLSPLGAQKRNDGLRHPGWPASRSPRLGDGTCRARDCHEIRGWELGCGCRPACNDYINEHIGVWSNRITHPCRVFWRDGRWLFVGRSCSDFLKLPFGLVPIGVLALRTDLGEGHLCGPFGNPLVVASTANADESLSNRHRASFSRVVASASRVCATAAVVIISDRKNIIGRKRRFHTATVT